MRFGALGLRPAVSSASGADTRTLLLLIEALTRNSYFEASVRELVGRGWQVTVAGLAGPDDLGQLLPGVRVVNLGSRSARDFPRASWRLRRLVHRVGPSGVLHAFDDIPTTVAVPAVAGWAGWRVINHRHHIETPLSWYWPRLARSTRAPVMACSRGAARAALAEGIPARRVYVATNGAPSPGLVTPSQTAELRARLSLQAGDLLVAFVARLRPEKGHTLLLDALQAMDAALRQRIVVAIVGDGPARAEVERRVAASAVRAVMIGHQDDVSPYYAAADLVVVPSEYESFGLVAAEAMAAGKPVVGSLAEGLRELVEDGVSGLLVERDRQAWTAALTAVLTDEALRARLAAAGRARYEGEFTIARMIDRWERVYADVAAGRSASPVA